MALVVGMLALLMLNQKLWNNLSGETAAEDGTQYVHHSVGAQRIQV